MLFVIMFIKIRLNYELYKLENIDVHIYVYILSQSIPVSMPGVWFRVLCGVRRTRSTCRAADIPLLCRDNLCYYVDRACD